MGESKVVYLHRKETDNSIFYVGMGNPYRAYATSSRNKWWNRTYKKHGLIVDVVADNLSTEDAYELEVFLISELGRKDKGLGNLVNLDDGGEGATGHIPTKEAREKLSKRLSKKVINTETLEVLSSATKMQKKYSTPTDILRKEHPSYDWMYLCDYNNGKHLTEKWINRYKIKNTYIKIINTETLEIFYTIESAAKSIGKGKYRSNESQYNLLSQKLKGSVKNTSDFMYYEDYDNGKHLTDEWINRKKIKPITPKEQKEIEMYDFKEQVWFKTTPKAFKEKYKQQPYTNKALCNGRYCRKDYAKFDKTNRQWKNILDLETGIVERFNQIQLANKLNVKSNNLSRFFLGKHKVVQKRYVIV